MSYAARPKYLNFLCFFLFLGICLQIFRLVHLSNAPFINDEPRLLTLVDASFLRGFWPAVGPVGSQPIPYGPIPHWFYQSVRYFSASPGAPHLAHVLIFLFAQLLVSLAVSFSLGRKVAVFFFVLLSSSPWLFVYSQMPWEVLLLVPGSAVVVFSLSCLRSLKNLGAAFGWGCAWGLGVGICVGSHLMSLSLIPASAVIFVLHWRRSKGTRIYLWLFVGAGLLVAGGLLMPYLQFLAGSRALGQPTHGERWGSLRHLWWSIIKSPLYLSVWQMKYFLEPQERVFFSAAGELFAKIYYLDILGWLAKAAMWVSGGVVLFRWIRARPVSDIQVFAILGVIFHVLLLQFLNLATYPHYFLPFWWAPFLLVSFWAEKKAASVFMGLLVLVNICFLYQFQNFIRENKGTRGWYYGSTFGEQERVFREICGRAGLEGIIDLSEISMKKYTAEYFMQRLPECSPARFSVVDAPTVGKRVKLQYASEASAALSWKISQ